jgi:hypothetical protein
VCGTFLSIGVWFVEFVVCYTELLHMGKPDRNIYCGTVACGTVLGIGVWFSETVVCFTE